MKKQEPTLLQTIKNLGVEFVLEGPAGYPPAGLFILMGGDREKAD